MINRRGFRRTLMSAVAFGALAHPAVAAAKDGAAAGAPLVGEIVVTAQRRTERLQDVPVAVTVVGGEAIERSGFRTLNDIQYLAASVQYNPYNGAGFQVRGVGSQGFDYSLNQSVGIMIDGVVLGIPRDPGLNSLTDIEGIEILRGPQGTLFGRNTSAGVINITTKRPELNRWGADGHATYGTADQSVVQANVNIPLGDTAALRLSGHNQHRDGYGRNLLTGEDLGRSTDRGVRGKLLWRPSDELDVYVIGSYQKTRSNGLQTIRSAAPSGSIIAADNAPYGIVFGPRNEDVADNVPSPGDRYRVWGVTATVDYHLGDHTLTSVTGYRRFVGRQVFSSDATPTNYIDNNVATNRSRQFTQEVRLTSPDSGLLTYVFGAYYFKANTEATQVQSGLLGFPPTLLPFIFGPGATQVSSTGGRDYLGARSESAAVFGQATLHATDKLSLIFGGRYTHDKVSSSYLLEPIPGFVPLNRVISPSFAEASSSKVSYKAGIQYDFTRDVMAYFTYSAGYKGPAFANLQGEALLIRPETSKDFEVGLKTALFDRRVTLNIAGFHQKYDDFQAQVYDTRLTPPRFRLGNAGGLKTEGFEAELTVRPTQSLSLSGAVTYARARFTDYVTACYTGQPLSNTTGMGCYLDPATGARVQDLAGKPLAAAPDWSFNLGANYRRPIFDGLVFDASANFAWKGDAYTIVPDPKTTIKAYGLLGLNVGLGSEDGQWRVGVFARNLLDTHFVSVIFPNFFDPFAAPAGVAPGYSQGPTAEARRTVGISLDYRWGT